MTTQKEWFVSSRASLLRVTDTNHKFCSSSIQIKLDIVTSTCVTIIVSITVDVDTKRSWTRTAGIKLTNAALLTKQGGRDVMIPLFCVISSGDTRVSSSVFLWCVSSCVRVTWRERGCVEQFVSK